MLVRNHRALGVGSGGTARDANALALYTARKCYYACEDSDGADMTDASGNGQTLSQTNSPGSTTGLVGNCRTFTAASSMKAARASETILQTGDADFSILLWVYITAASDFQGFIGKYDGGGNSEWAFYEGATGTLQPRFGISTNGTSIDGTSVIDLGEVTTGAWHLLAAWHTASDKKLRGSVDAGTVVVGSAYSGTITARSAPLTVGSLDGSAFYFGGRLDQIYYGSTALTQAYIDWYYNAGAGRTYTELEAG